MSGNAVYVWDFTLKAEMLERIYVKQMLREFCKTGTFQLEESAVVHDESICMEDHMEYEVVPKGYRHFQGRVSLKKKMRLPPIDTLKGIHWSRTSKANFFNTDYCTKNYSRIAGPWNIEDEEPYIPKQIREIKILFPWQQAIVDNLNNWDTRTINCVVDFKGNIGKSVLVGWVRAHNLGRVIPPINDYKDLMRMVCCMPTAQSYMIDMPKALKKDKLNGFYTAIESVKNGYAFDERYKFVEKIFDSPNIWVFTNSLPETEMLSNDRWKCWEVNELNELIPIKDF